MFNWNQQIKSIFFFFLFEGGDDINQLVDADEKEFKEIVELVGMASKPLHVKRLRKAIDEYKNSNGKLLNGWLNFFVKIYNDSKLSF